eukprot:CAMPEP_0168618524 /NCGR_PEP_ID=MMETSP0449_2-20121227/6118_1 /TAXON_ID=1082188 /ORGANISM="Strombidium rassoulzadegani, Strain ras09" /LENGTH=95 /DNA_ID=CAMNT_0008659405 /DNA_START=20 /DNA_END=307 /DNA_ORIENTATION=+
MSTPIILTIKVVRAEMKQDADFFGKMDPFCVLNHEQGNEYRTNTKDEAGKTPRWNQKFEFKAYLEDSITFSVYDEDTMQNEYLGSSTREVSELID